MTPVPFAQALAAARTAAGLTQAALGRRAGLTAAYVSLLESGRRRPPRAPVVERLARALALPPAPLLEAAALERSPDPVRHRLAGLDGERDRLGRARDRVLSTTLFHLSRRPRALIDMAVSHDPTDWLRATITRVGPRLQQVRSAREAGERSHELLAPLPPPERQRLLEALPAVLEEAPATAPPATLCLPVQASLAAGRAPAGETLHVDARLAHPGCFLWRLSSDEAHPRLEQGDLLLLDPQASPRAGQIVALHHEGVDHVRRVCAPAGALQVLEALRPDLPPLRLEPAAFRPAGVVRSVLRTLAPGGA